MLEELRELKELTRRIAEDPPLKSQAIWTFLLRFLYTGIENERPRSKRVHHGGLGGPYCFQRHRHGSPHHQKTCHDEM